MVKSYYNKKNGAKFVVHIAVALFLLCFFSVIMIFKDSSKNSVWQNFAEYDFEVIHIEENNVEVNVANVTNANQLAGALNQIEKQIKSPTHFSLQNKIDVVKLVNDIDMSGNNWIPVKIESEIVNKNSLNFFVFDGNNKTIKNLHIKYTESEILFANSFDGNNIGLFSTFFWTIKNLTFENAQIIASNNKIENVGCLAGELFGDVSNITIKNSHINVESGGSESAVGGIVGKLTGSVDHANNFANVKSSSLFVSGGFGLVYGDVKNITNYGDVFSYKASSYEKNVAGVVAKVINGKVENCSNFGRIEDTIDYGYSSNATLNVGGIVGNASNTNISACANYGYVQGGSSAVYKTRAGGIVGYTNKDVEVCYNKGSVFAYAKQTSATNKTTNLSSSVKGGFFSGSEHGKTGPDSDNSYTTLKSGGKIEFSTSQTSAYAGGIAGFATVVKNCYNKGAVYGGYFAITALVSCSFYFYGDEPGFSNYKNTRDIIYGQTKKLYLYNGICGNNYETINCYSKTTQKNYITTKNSSYQGFEYQYDKKEVRNSNNILDPNDDTITTTLKYVIYDINIKFEDSRAKVEFFFGVDYIVGTKPAGGGGGVVYKSSLMEEVNYELLADAYASITTKEYRTTKNYDYYNSNIKSIDSTNYSTEFNVDNFGGLAYWKTDPKINDGEPFPKNWYW